MYDIIIYYSSLYVIGGIETFLYQLGKIYKNKNLVFMCKDGDKKQLERMKTVYKEVILYEGQKIKCNKFIFNGDNDVIILPNIDAKEYIRIVHNDYITAKWNITDPQNIDRIIDKNKIEKFYFDKPIKYYGVSSPACVSIKRLLGKDSQVCHNPFELDREPRKVLHLISTTRLHPTKGGERMKKLAKAFEENNIPYIWTIFSNEKLDTDNPNFVQMKQRLDIIDYIADADYLVQLSDFEGYPYVILEALSVGTPVIVTNYRGVMETGVNKDNSFILDFDMKNIPIKEIYNKKFNFEYKPPKTKWDEILA